MRAVLQRVQSASVTVDGEVTGAIGPGVLVYLGVAADDTAADTAYMAGKIRDLRVFEDDAGRMNRSLLEAGGAVLLVSQFTLHGDVRRGRRPSFIGAAPPDQARPIYDAVATALRASGLQVETGVFRAHMLVACVNDGPVTILIDSRKVF